MCFFHHQCSHNGTSTGLYLRPLNVPFCLSSNVFEVGNWHDQIGTFSPQEIEFNSSMTTNDNGRDDKIVVKITTKMGQLYNSISVTDSLFFFITFYFSYTFDKQNRMKPKQRAQLIRQNSLLPLFFSLYCYFPKSLLFASVYFYMRIGISALHPTVCVWCVTSIMCGCLPKT